MFSGSPKGRIQGPQDFVGVWVAGSQLGLRDLGFCGANLGGGFRIQACLPCPCRSFNTSVCSI